MSAVRMTPLDVEIAELTNHYEFVTLALDPDGRRWVVEGHDGGDVEEVAGGDTPIAALVNLANVTKVAQAVGSR